MRAADRSKQALLGGALLGLCVSTAAADLHPLRQPLPDGAIAFELRDWPTTRKQLVVETTYRPYRERDVRKDWHLHLFDSIWRIGSRDLLTTTREEFRSVVQTVDVSGGRAGFTIPLHAVEAGYQAYQLESVRAGGLVFERWFAEPPMLAPEFGLRCSSDGLRGSARPTGLGAAPLNGSLPLWPGLRTVQLSVVAIRQPDARAWDPTNRHQWDGWRSAVPRQWPGGETVVTRRVEGPNVWRSHAYFAFGPAGSALPARPVPPDGTLPGVALEVWWPQGDRLEFPDANFDRPWEVLGFRVARLAERVREILARSVAPRPGVELHSVTMAEWEELAGLAETKSPPGVEFAVTPGSTGRDLLVAHRRKLTEPWLYVVGMDYDADRRVSIGALVLDPSPWKGPVPE